MQTLRYSRGKLLFAAAMGMLCALFFIAAFLNPDAFAGSRRGRIFTTDLGHYVFAPLLIAVCSVLAWRAAAIACGTLAAVECSASALHVTGLWGRRRIGWTDLVSIVVERTAGQNQLVFLTRSGGLFGGNKVRLSLGLTQLHESRTEDFIDGIADYRAAILARTPRPDQSPVTAETAPRGSDRFDPDEAFARYQARKAAAESGGDVLTPTHGAAAPGYQTSPAVRARPVFGRKAG